MLVNALRRAWRVYADPAESEAAHFLKVMVPLAAVGYVVRVAFPDGWPRIFSNTLAEAGLWCALLWVVRQRDEARAVVKAAKFEYAVKLPRFSDDRIWEWRGPRDEGSG